MRIQPNSTLLMIGDSITDCGRVRPIGDSAAHMALGDGFVRYVHGLLFAAYPDYDIRILNMGISGNTVRDLKARWQTDVIDLQPDWLSVMIGINDVWRHFDTPRSAGRHVPIDEYERTLTELLEATRPGLQGLVLMTPFFIEPERNDPLRAMMDSYGGVVRRLAERFGALFVDTQAAFDTALQSVHSMRLAADRVHPGTAGHMILARAFLDGIGFDWSRTL